MPCAGGGGCPEARRNRVIILQNGAEENKNAEAVENIDKKEKKPRARGRGWLVFFVLLIFLIGGGGGVAYYKMDSLSAFARAKISEYAKQYLNADLTVGALRWHPVFGLSVRDIEISRGGETMLSVGRVTASLSVPSLVSGSPRLSRLAVSGVDTSMEKIQSLIPKTEKKEESAPLNIPIDLIFVRNVKVETPYGAVAVDKGALRIEDSKHFDAEASASVNGVAVVIDGAVENTPEGGWSSSGLAVELDGGRAELSGALFPSQDVKFALTDFDLSTAAKLVPKIGEYGVKGRLSGEGSASLAGGKFVSEGSGTLNKAVVRGMPLDGVAVKWSVTPELIKAELNQGKVFDSELAGSLELDMTKPDKYLKFSAEAKNLKFDDWKSQLGGSANGAAAAASGEISSLTANLEGPLNALKGRVELGPSQLGYKQIKLKDLRGSAVFDGKPAGVLDLTGTSEGRVLALKGTLSLGDKIPTDLTFTSEGIVLDKVLKSFPQTAKLKADGSIAVSGTCKGLMGKWVVGLRASTPSVSVDKIGKISNISVISSYAMETGVFSLERASAQWNGVTATAEGTFSQKAANGGALNFKGTFKNADVKRFYSYADILKTLKVSGVASGSWSVAGAPSAPVVKATVKTGTAQFRTLKIAKLEAGIAYSGDSLKLSPVTAYAGGGTGTVNCDVTLPSKKADGTAVPASWKMNGQFSKVDFSIINGLLEANEDISGEVSGKVTAGSAADGLNWSFDFSGKKLAWREFRVDELAGVITGSPKEILIESTSGLFLKGETSGTGRIEMPAPGQSFSDAKLEIRAGIKKLNLYELVRRHLPAARSVQGLVDGDVVVSGTVGNPRFDATARVAPLRYRGFMLPMIDVKCGGTMKEVEITEAKAVLRDGDFGAHGRFWSEEGEWYGDFDIKGTDIDVRQFSAYMPDNFRARLGGTANFSMEGSGKLAEISGTGSITSPYLRLLGVKFEDLSAPFYVSKHYMIVEDLKAKTNGGTLSGGAGFDFENSRWGGNLTVMGTDLKALMSQLAPNMKGSISGKADLKIRGSGETGRMSTVRGGGALSLTDGELSGFSFVEKAKKFTGGKPIRYKTVQATFTYMDGIFTLLPGSQAIAPDGDMLYRNVMVDGAINSEKELSFFALGKVNIRALNSVLGAFQGIISAGSDLASGTLNKEEALQSLLGGVISGFAKNEFKFIGMGIGGTVSNPEITHLRVSQAMNMRSSKALIPSSGGDPEDNETMKDGNTTFRFKFEIPMGPGTDAGGGTSKGDFVGQTLENLINNIDFGL